MATEQRREKISKGPQNVPRVEDIDYEVNLLTLFSLKALISDEIADFHIESRNNRYGKFNDIILTLTPVNGQIIKIAFQLKHKSNAKIVNREQQQHVKGDFDIPKYFNSYQEIKVEDKHTCHYVLFTNNQISLSNFNSQGSKYSIVQDTSNILFNIFNSGEFHKFRSNNDVSHNGFLDRFYLFSGQSNEKEVENEIEEIFTQNFGSNETANTASVLKLFKDLHKGRFTDEKLNKATLICHLINLLILRHHSINLEQVRTGQESLCEHFYNAVKLFDVTHISCENMDFLKQNLKHINYVSEENLFRWAKCYKFIDGKMCLKDFEVKSNFKVLYHIDNQPIVLNYSRDSAKAINCVMKLCIKKFPQIKFILAGSKTDLDFYIEDPDLHYSNLFENLSSLKLKDHRVYQQLINQFEVKLNGRKLASLAEFISINDQIANDITPNIISNSLKTGVIKFGDESNYELPPHYMPRQISGDVLSFENLAEDKDTSFIISCGRQLGQIQDFFKSKNLISVDFDKIGNETTNIHTNIILTTSKTFITEYELNKKICHKFQKMCYLEAIVKNKRFLGNFRYRKHKKDNLKKIMVEENEIQKYFQRSIEVLSATPGMGKTTLLKSIARECPPEYFCILIPLINYSDFFKQKHSIVDLLSQYFSKTNVAAKFQAHFTRYIFQKCKVMFMFDGFDDIDRRSHNHLFNCIEEVRKMRQKIWISTRPNFSELLQNRFDVNDLEIVELNENTQREYIKNKLSESNKTNEIDEIITKIYENIIIERHQTLLGTPLLLHIITEMVINNEDLLNINNITDLLKYFFKGKFEHYLSKQGSSFVKDYFNVKLDSYKIPALKSCLEADLFHQLNLSIDTEQVESIRNSGDALGVIVNVSEDADNPNFSFFHNIYAEYFAAKWLAANYKRIPIWDRTFLLEGKYENLKFMFDILMAEGCPAHIGVICGNEKCLAKCTENEIVKTDKLNRSVWHIICEFGDKFPSTGISYSKRVYKIDEYICGFQPKNPQQNLYKYLEKAEIPLLERDILFNKTALDYATERFSINIFDNICKIFQTPYIDFNKLRCLSDNKYLIIYYSLKFGYINLLQLNFIRNVLATQTLTYYESDDYSFSERRVNVVYIAAKYGQLEVIKYLYAFENSYDTFDDPPLRVAAEKGHLAIIRELIAHNADVNETDKYGWTPLIWATVKGHLDLVKEFIAHNADVNAANKYGKTPLFWATVKGHLNIVKEFIAHKAEVNATNKDGRTPLGWAAEKGHLDIVKELIAHNAEVNARNKDGVTPLFWAAVKGHLGIVKELLTHNADINAANKHGGTSLGWAADKGHLAIVRELIAHNADVNATNKDGKTPLFLAAEKGHLDIVKDMIAHNADVNATNKDGKTPLFLAAEKGHLDIVKDMIAHNADINATDKDGKTPLFWAAIKCHLNIVKDLIAHKADVNATDKKGWTPVFYAAFRGHFDIVKELIAHNADVNATDKDGKTPLFCATFQGNLDIIKELIAHNANVNAIDKEGCTPLFLATQEGHLHIVKEFIAHNADINTANKHGGTPLGWAAEKGHLDIVKELIAHKAYVNATDKEGWTPLFLAAQEGHLHIVKEFIAHNANVNATDIHGGTPLRYAAEKGYLDIIKELIAHNADVNATIKNGRTPLLCAAFQGHLDIVEELIACKADVNATDKDGWTLLRWTVSQGHLDIVKELIARKADVNATNKDGETPLFWAAFRGHLDIVKELIAHNADVNAIDKDGRSCLGWAAQKGHLDIVKELIAHNADVNAANKNGKTPLFCAAFQGHLNIVKELIAYNADVNATDKDGKTPLFWATFQGNLDIIKEFIAHNANVNAIDKEGWTPLFLAAQEGHLHIVKEYIAHNADINTANKHGGTPLGWAAEKGHLDIVKELIAHKACVNATDKEGWSPLFFAASQGHLNIAKEFIAHNANVNATDKHGGTPLRWAAEKGYLDIIKELIAHNADVNATDKEGWTPLFYAASQGHLDIVKELIAHEADVNATDKERWTPLFLAAQEGHLDVVKKLIAHNADVNATDKDGKTPLFCAAFQGHLDIVRELIAYNADVNATDKNGRTPLGWAAQTVHLDIVKELIAHNADVNATDKDGRTPMFCAAFQGHLDVVKELIAHNANVNATDKDGRTPLGWAAERGHEDVVKELIPHMQT